MSTTIRIEDLTLKELRQNKIEYQAKHKIPIMNDNDFVVILLGKHKK
jgi:hypothetical protein|tara:strand:+ start:1365 stop:1505 length:141 start_codon:yes stop_codon:yes gene_type:complete